MNCSRTIDEQFMNSSLGLCHSRQRHYANVVATGFDLILIWLNGTSAHMGHFSA